LFVEEGALLKLLKSRILGMAAIHKMRARQRSRLTWLQLGDADTKYFQMMANSRRKRNFIASLQGDDLVALIQEDKQNVVFQHFMKHIGYYAPRSCNLNFSNLG
jgi:hypothetical protein